MRTQEMVGSILAILKGGSVPPSSHMSPCSTVPLSEQTTDVDSCEETNVGKGSGKT